MTAAKAAILILLLLIFWPFVLKMHLWLPLDGELRHFGGDFAGIFYAWLQSAIDGWQHEGLPLYTPYEGLGMPLHTNLQSMVFYPPTVLVAQLFPNGISFHAAEIYNLLHLCLAGIGAFLLARVVGLNRWPAAFSGAAFVGGGFFLNHIANMSLTASAAWTPWVLAATLKAVERNGWRWVPAAAAAIALSVLGGLPQPAYYVVILVSLIAVWTAIDKRHFYPLGRYFVIGVLAFAFASPALLPGAVDLPLLVRGGDWGGDMNAPELLTARLLSPVAPQVTAALGATAAFASFTGIGVFILAIGGMTGRLLRKRRVLLACLALVFFMAIAATLNLDGLLRTLLPGYGFFREHERAGVLVTLLVALFAGAGLQSLGQWRPVQRNAALASGFLILAIHALTLIIPPSYVATGPYVIQTLFFAAIALLTTGAVFLGRFRYIAFGAAICCLLELAVLGNTNNLWPGIDDSLKALGKKVAPLHNASDQALPRIARRSKQNIATQIAAFKLNTLYTGNSNSYRLLLRFWSLGERYPYILSQFDVRYFLLGNHLEEQSRTVADFPLSAKNQVQRFDLGNPTCREILIEADGAIEAAAVVDSTVTPLKFVENAQRQSTVGRLSLEKEAPLESLWIRSLGDNNVLIKSILIDGTELILPSRFEQIGHGLYRDNDALPRAHLVPSATYISRLPRVAKVLRKEVDLQERVLISQKAALPPETTTWNAEQWAAAEVDITRYGRRIVEIEIEAPTEAWLVLSDFFHKNWRATLDGKEVPVKRANLIARAVHVPAGRHTVIFRFEDPLVIIGLWIAGGSVVAGMAILWIGLRVKREEAE